MVANASFPACCETHPSLFSTLCTRYVNWLARRHDHRFMDMAAGIADVPGPSDAPAVEMHSLWEAGGIAELLRTFNVAYVGAVDYHKAGWIQAIALQASPRYDPRLIWMAYREGEAVGFCMARRCGDRGWIAGIGVAPRWRGQGIGKALMLKAVDCLRSDGATVVEVSVDRQNNKSIGLLRGSGFRAI